MTKEEAVKWIIIKDRQAADAIKQLRRERDEARQMAHDELESRMTRDGEYQFIYLSPHCSRCLLEIAKYGDGLLWCEDQQEPCEECGKEWIRYERVKDKSDEN